MAPISDQLLFNSPSAPVIILIRNPTTVYTVRNAVIAVPLTTTIAYFAV